MTRAEAVEFLVDLLESLEVAATVRWKRRTVADWPNSRRWPPATDGVRRAWMAAHLRACLSRVETSCLVGVWLDDDDVFATFDWPAASPPAAVAVVIVTATVESQSAKPAKASGDCARDVAVLLRRLGRRLTCEEMEGELAKPGQYAWSLSCIQATCGWQRKIGGLDNEKDARGRGFGPIDWQDLPAD